jgi:hypothetical protein
MRWDDCGCAVTRYAAGMGRVEVYVVFWVFVEGMLTGLYCWWVDSRLMHLHSFSTSWSLYGKMDLPC